MNLSRISPSARTVLGLAVLIASSGCTLAVPNGLFGQLQGGASPKPAEVAGSPGVTEPGKPGQGRPPSDPARPGDPTMKPAPRDCKGEFMKADMDHSGGISLKELQQVFGCKPNMVDGVMVNAGSTTVQANGDIDMAQVNADGSVNAIASGPNGAKPCPAFDQKTFMHFDVDGNGELGPDELCRLLDEGNPPPTPPSMMPGGPGCDETFKKADVDGDGRISLDEFIRTDPSQPSGPRAETTMAAPPQEGLKIRFSERDRNRDGFLTHEEWCGGLTPPVMPPDKPPVANGVKVTCDDIGKFDRDSDKQLSWDEYFGGLTSTVRLTQDGMVTFKAQAYEQFRASDSDGNGFVTADEACGGSTGGGDDDTACNQRFDHYDTSDNEELDENEYVEGRMGEIRYVKAPTPEETRRMRESTIQDFKRLDRDNSGNLDRDEFGVDCGE